MNTFNIQPGRARRYLLAAVITSLLSACVSTGQYTTDPPAVPATYGRGDAALNAPVQASASTDGAVHADVREDTWWTGFNDPRLDRVIARALTANTDLASAGLAVQRARLQAGLSDNALWPQPSGSVSSSGSRAIDQSADWNRGSSAGVSLQWEIDLWGRLRTQRDIAQWEAQATEEDRQNTALLVIGDVATQYWTLAFLNQSIAAGQANLERLERTRGLVQARFDAGAVSRLEVRQASQSLEAQRSAQSALEQQRVVARNALTVLLDGQPWPLEDEPQVLESDGSPSLDEGLPAELLGRRPDLRAAELRLRNSLKNIKVTATSYYPALSLTGGVNSSATSLSDVLKNPVGTLGAGLSLPFLNIREAQLNTRIPAPTTRLPPMHSGAPCIPPFRRWTTRCRRGPSWPRRWRHRRRPTTRRWRSSGCTKCATASARQTCARGWKRSRRDATRSCRWPR